MSFPITPILDTFAGIGIDTVLSAYSGNWGPGQDPDQVELVGTGANAIKGAGSFGENYWTNAFSSDDNEAFLAITTLPGANDYVDVLARVNDPSGTGRTGYQFEYNMQFTRFRLYRTIGNTNTALATRTDITLTGGMKIGLRVTNSNPVRLEGYLYQGGAWDQTPILTFDDSDAARLTVGKFISVGALHADWVLDDFGGGGIPQEAPNRVIIPTTGGMSW